MPFLELDEMFTKRHYEAIADTIRKSEFQINKGIIKALINLFSEDNPRFDKAKFLKACGEGV
jgi:hypothetical protein